MTQSPKPKWRKPEHSSASSQSLLAPSWWTAAWPSYRPSRYSKASLWTALSTDQHPDAVPHHHPPSHHASLHSFIRAPWLRPSKHLSTYQEDRDRFSISFRVHGRGSSSGRKKAWCSNRYPPPDDTICVLAVVAVPFAWNLWCSDTWRNVGVLLLGGTWWDEEHEYCVVVVLHLDGVFSELSACGGGKCGELEFWWW